MGLSPAFSARGGGDGVPDWVDRVPLLGHSGWFRWIVRKLDELILPLFGGLRAVVGKGGGVLSGHFRCVVGGGVLYDCRLWYEKGQCYVLDLCYR